MSYTHKVDTNQAQIVSELRQIGYRVTILARMGNGIPDLLVADDSRMVLAEVKRRGQHLTPQEEEFFELWPPTLRIVAYCAEDVLQWFEKL